MILIVKSKIPILQWNRLFIGIIWFHFHWDYLQRSNSKTVLLADFQKAVLTWKQALRKESIQ